VPTFLQPNAKVEGWATHYFIYYI